MAKRPRPALPEPLAPEATPEPEMASAGTDAAPEPVRRAPIEPIGTVRRTLVRPDGTKIAVDVPVYPPFRLETGEPAPPAPKPPRRMRPARPRPTGSD